MYAPLCLLLKKAQYFWSHLFDLFKYTGFSAYFFWSEVFKPPIFLSCLFFSPLTNFPQTLIYIFRLKKKITI